MADRIHREQLEQAVLDQTWHLDLDNVELDWLCRHDFTDLLAAWRALANYYTAHSDDTTISVAIMGDYMHLMRRLRRALLNPRLDTDRKQCACEVLTALESQLETIVEAVTGATIA
jgi:hypothetical protein